MGYVTKFLSTPSARRATAFSATVTTAFANFYPRPPRGGRLDGRAALCGLVQISIHALREEGDLPLELALTLICDFYPRPPRGGRLSEFNQSSLFLSRFLSTPSARRATVDFVCDLLTFFISIHALREEGDLQRTSIVMMRSHFYPRPPRGGRLPRPA